MDIFVKSDLLSALVGGDATVPGRASEGLRPATRHSKSSHPEFVFRNEWTNHSWKQVNMF